jgi:hypothetical protein
MLDDAMTVYVDALALAYPTVREIWLFGSRAAGVANSDSDWDFFVFADSYVLGALALDQSFNRADTDVLVIYDGDHFREPWVDGDKGKAGSLSGWEWKRTTDDEATYKATKASKEDDFYVEITTERAVRVWPQLS